MYMFTIHFHFSMILYTFDGVYCGEMIETCIFIFFLF